MRRNSFGISGGLEFNSNLPRLFSFDIVYKPNLFLIFRPVMILGSYAPPFPGHIFFLYLGTTSWRVRLCTHILFFFSEETAISDVLICNIKCSLNYFLKRQSQPPSKYAFGNLGAPGHWATSLLYTSLLDPSCSPGYLFFPLNFKNFLPSSLLIPTIPFLGENREPAKA